MRVCKQGYDITFSNKGNITELTNNADHLNVVNKNSSIFGLPFLNSTQQKDKHKKLKLTNLKANMLSFKGKNYEATYHFYDHFFTINAKFTDVLAGPRNGITFDYSFLDSDEAGYENKLMVTDIYVDPNYKYGYFLLRRHDGQYVIMTVNSRFAAYRLKYSYFGHKVVGMQVLASARDVIFKEGRNMIQTDSLNISIAFSSNLREAKKRVAELLNISIAAYKLSGNIVGSDFEFTTINHYDDLYILGEDDKQVSYKEENNKFTFNLDKATMYRLITVKNNKQHISYVLSHKKWEKYYELICDFYRRNFQHKTGAFYRVIFKNTLSPEGGRTFEGVHFGNPYERMSCRTGEFGGFAGWAMIKYLLTYSAPDIFKEGVKTYIENWALNLHNSRKPFYGTLSRKAHRHGLKRYSAYHLYKEINFPQYEIFLMEQLLDYYKLTKKAYIFEDLFNIADHFITDHIGENGEVNYRKTDYTTVHTPTILYVKLAQLCDELDMKCESKRYKVIAKNMVEYLVRRGLDFPTEGEGCTEDGSIACSALSILYYCFHVEYKDQYVRSAKKMLDLHKMLELTTYDAKMYMSSIRFWETQYESNDYGPSYNAGHAWTLWSAEAKVYYALITGHINYLLEAYNGFITNIAKVEKNGGMTVSYTPDMIPGTPHHAYMAIYTPLNILKRNTQSHLGMRYPSNTYSATGNYFLVKYEETFNYISGIDLKNNQLINMEKINNTYICLGANFNTVIIDNLISKTIRLKVNRKLKIIANEIDQLEFVNAEIICRKNKSVIIKPTANEILIVINKGK